VAKQAPDEVDTLFQIPLSEFTSARNTLIAKLKKDGDVQAAERVKTLGKPSISAWVANQLYWRHRKAFDQLLAAGEQFRKAQTAQLAGKSADLRAPLDARRAALAELTRHAADVLRDAGHPASPDTMRRVTTTLEALATYGEQPGAPEAGRLTADVDPPGFEALAALVPRGIDRVGHREAPPRVIPFNQPKPKPAKSEKTDSKEEARVLEAERRAREAEARKEVREAERALAEARKTAERARAAMKQAAARANATEKARAALESRLEKLTAAAEAARQAARRVASQAEEAAQAVDDAERAVKKAKAAVEADLPPSR
jgi:hypothetical protein